LIDVVALSAPLDEAMPAGPNLEYENEFVALESDARGKPERQFGETVIKATEPDWGDIRDRCAALLARSRDLRLACLLTRAQTRTEGLAGLANGLVLLTRLCETLWPTVHPALESDEPDDAMPRLNVLSVLTDSEGLLQDVRAAALVSGRGPGNVPVRAAEVALGILPAPRSEGAEDGGSGGPSPMGLEAIAAAIRAAHGAGAEDPARAALAAAEALKATVSRQSGTEFDLDPLLRRLRPLAKLFGDALGAASATDTPGSGPATDDGAGGTAPDDRGGAVSGHGGQVAGAIRISGTIGSRDDAVRVLERVCEYLDRHEPTNPAPLLIRRAQRLMTMNFVDIVREMAPEGLGSLHKITGLAPPE
jgi:type VI secretion system protein ImpA